MNKPKILMTCSVIDKGGGVDQHLFAALPLLLEYFQVEVLTGKEQNWQEFKDIPGLVIHTSQHMEKEISPIKDLKAIWECYNIIKKGQYELVQTHQTKASIVTRIAAWMAKVPVLIYGLRGVTFNDPMSKAKRNFYIGIEKTTLWMNDFIIPVSQDAINEYHKVNLGTKIPYQIVYSAIDVEKLDSRLNFSDVQKAKIKEELGYQQDDFIISNIGRFSFAKGQRYTINAFSKFCKAFPQAKLLMVGDGDELENCKALAKQLNIEGQVNFLGHSDDVAEILAITNLISLSSLREGLPRVVIEGAFSKIPTVAFEVEGIYEAIVKDKSGYIVPRFDVDSMAEKMKYLFQNPTTCFQMGMEARDHVKRQWDRKNVVLQLKDLYLKLIDNKK